MYQNHSTVKNRIVLVKIHGLNSKISMSIKYSTFKSCMEYGSVEWCTLMVHVVNYDCRLYHRSTIPSLTNLGSLCRLYHHSTTPSLTNLDHNSLHVSSMYIILQSYMPYNNFFNFQYFILINILLFKPILTKTMWFYVWSDINTF